MMKKDDWFKLLLLFFVIAFLIICYWYSQNGRYSFVHFGDNLCAADSRTGIVYSMDSGKAYKLDYPLGKMTTSPIQNNPPSKQ